MKDIVKVTALIGATVISVIAVCGHPVMCLWVAPVYAIFAGCICRR